jgi:single-strand DNA-binding protein
MPTNPEIYNEVTIVGNLGADPDLRYFESGACKAQFNIAVWQGKDEKTGQDRPSTWLRIEAWKEVAEQIANTLRKGDKGRFFGKIEHDEWMDKASGQKRTMLKIKAFRFEKIERTGQSRRDDNGYTPYADDDF